MYDALSWKQFIPLPMPKGPFPNCSPVIVRSPSLISALFSAFNNASTKSFSSEEKNVPHKYPFLPCLCVCNPKKKRNLRTSMWEQKVLLLYKESGFHLRGRRLVKLRCWQSKHTLTGALLNTSPFCSGSTRCSTVLMAEYRCGRNSH